MPLHQIMNMLVAQSEAQPQGAGVLDIVIQVGLILVIFYFLLIRPQQKRTKDHQTMLSSLKRDQEVVTSGGLFGKITNITDTVVTLEVAQNVRVKVQRSQVAGLKTNEAQAKDK